MTKTGEATFINDLNKVQYDAVSNHDGPSLVIAGAGSGKTRVLTYRIANLLSKGIPASQILSLTFTNKAAKEMKERVASLVGYEKAKYLWMGTFHSIFAKILRYEAETLGYSSNFTIYDTADSKSLIKTIIKELNLDDQQYKPNEVLSRISAAKNNLITAATYEGTAQYTERDKATKKPAVGQIYKIYSARCFKADAMDFDDLLLKTNVLFRNHPEVLAKYASKFNYILVDEYQDTNFSQYLIIKKLSAVHQNICVVGDDAQSIYSFRGAKIENILNFRNDYPNHQTYKLEQNYRSTQNIVNAANSIIKRNKNQIEKKVWSANAEGEKIGIIEANTDNEEGFIIANKIIDLKLNNQLIHSDFAILYRTNAQSRIFEESLRRLNIPYKVHGGLSFYQRKEIKDLIAYFRLIINKKDEEALKRIINFPTRGIGKTTIDKLEKFAIHSDQTIWELISNYHKYDLGLNKGTLGKLARFIELINHFSNQLSSYDAYDMAYEVASTTGILKELHNEKTPEGISRYENIQELLNGIKEFALNKKEEEGINATLEHYIENVSLLTDDENEKSEDRDKVTLMTIHSAKGLEFKVVFVVGVEENLFPSHMSTSSQQDLEEERRLFYVAVTRAMDIAMVSFAHTRYKWGNLNHCSPSRFIKEIDSQFIDKPIIEDIEPIINQNQPDNETSNFPKRKQNKSIDSIIKPQRKLKAFNTAANEKEQSGNYSKSDEIQSGMIVSHERFGKGKVENIEGDPSNLKATVVFENFGQKQLLLKFAKLKIVKS